MQGLTTGVYLLAARPRRPENCWLGLLQLAQEQFPQSGVVQARWGDLYSRQGQRDRAIGAYQAALRANPEDKDLREKLLALTQQATP